jgi:two-component system sensor histidine kinase KdpD
VDHGPGVAEGDRERIFAPFQRLGDQDASTGVGLGLAVARGFVEAVGGSLIASETPGGGLTMTVTLPAVRRRTTPGARTRL